MAGRVLLGFCAALVAIAVAGAAEGQVASVVVGLARCADCTRKNMKAETAFKGLQVAIKCKNTNGEYETKAVSELQSSGAFSVPLAADLHGADCHAQLHSAANAPCPGQEPSRVAPMSGGTFVAIPGKTHYPSAECASAFLCAPIKKHFLDHFHKKPVPEHKPAPEYHPVPEHKPAPEYHPVPEHKPAPEYHPVPEHKPAPEYHPVPEHKPAPEYHPVPEHKPAPEYHPTPEYHPPTPEYHPPTPEYHPPTPEYHPPTPVYGQPKPTPIYHPPAEH